MSKRSILIGAGLLLAALMFWVAWGEMNSHEKQSVSLVKIAVALPLDTDVGRGMYQAAQLALAQRGGSINGTKVEILSLDTRNPDGQFPITQQDITAAQRAIADELVVAMLGAGNSSAARDIIPMLNEAGLVLISPSATAPSLTKPGFVAGEPAIFYPSGRQTFFRVTPTDEVQGAAAAAWMQQQGWTRVFTITNSTPYTQQIIGILEAAATDQGLEMVGQTTYELDSSAEDLERVLATLAEAQPDVVYIPGASGTNLYQLILALRADDPDLPVMGADGLANEALPEDTLPLDGVCATDIAPYPDADLPFYSAYRDAYGQPPSAFALLTYEAMQALLLSIEQASSPTREGVLQAVQQLNIQDSTLGQWHFDTYGDINTSNVTVLCIQEGAWQVVERLR